MIDWPITVDISESTSGSFVRGVNRRWCFAAMANTANGIKFGDGRKRFQESNRSGKVRTSDLKEID